MLSTITSLLNVVVCFLGFAGCLYLLTKSTIDTRPACRTLPISFFGLGWAALLYAAIDNFNTPVLTYTISAGFFLAGLVSYIVLRIIIPPRNKKKNKVCS